MTTRKQLEEILAVQRVQRAHSSANLLRKRGRDLVGALAVIVILIASGAAMFFAVQMTTPKMNVTAVASPAASPAPSATYTTTVSYTHLTLPTSDLV